MQKANQLSAKLKSYVTKANKNARVIKLNLSDLDIANKAFESNEVFSKKTPKSKFVLRIIPVAQQLQYRQPIQKACFLPRAQTLHPS